MSFETYKNRNTLFSNKEGGSTFGEKKTHVWLERELGNVEGTLKRFKSYQNTNGQASVADAADHCDKAIAIVSKVYEVCRASFHKKAPSQQPVSEPAVQEQKTPTYTPIPRPR